MHDADLRGWLEQRMERTRNRCPLPPDARRRLLEKVVEAETLEQFLATRFLGAKRFSIEGAEGLLPLFELLLDRAVGHGVRNVVIGMAHRGRLNALANVVGKPLREIFAEFRDTAIVNAGGGDVKYHLGYSSDRETPDGVLVHLSLSFNPSHLEWIDTVVQGRVRAKQDRYADLDRVRSVPVLVHGDAAFAGQGIVAESLQMSELEAYAVGGTIHVIVNNQVGFTTSPHDARSTTYCTGPARMLQIPIIHVNGEDLEAIAQAVLLAVDFRQRFHRDVVIDLWTYRRHGHNEGDEPSFTQPLMYRAIARKPTLKAVYAEQLAREGVVAPADVEAMTARYRARLEQAFHDSAARAVHAGAQAMGGFWKAYRGGAFGKGAEAPTGVAGRVAPRGRRPARPRAAGLPRPPEAREGPRGARRRWCAGARPLDWAMAEALAFGTLAWEGTRVRLVGQDTRRGTFSHRHAVLFDQERGTPYAPLSHLRSGQGPVEIRDSLLSEAAALGFEYGYSLELPEALVVWEAQFGDFVNAAQVIVDQFLSSGEAKWNRLSGLVLLLPHGMEGQGPEHSSARLERFLELSVDDNWRVVNLTTPANYFHALRRQVVSPWRKPLVVMSPKSLLRHPQATLGARRARAGALPAGDRRRRRTRQETTRVVLCSGKLYYDLAAAREGGRGEARGARPARAAVPDRGGRGARGPRPAPSGVEIVWAQEEPSNMGAWNSIDGAARAAAPRSGPARRARALREPGRGLRDAPQAGAGAARARGARGAGVAARPWRRAPRAGTLGAPPCPSRSRSRRSASRSPRRRSARGSRRRATRSRRTSRSSRSRARRPPSRSRRPRRGCCAAC